MGRNYGSTSNSNECTPLVSGSDSNGHPSVSSHSNANNGATTATVDNGGNSNNDLWEELDRPWPATFERAVSLLASPVLNRRDIQHYTSSPKPGSTPLALQRRRTLSKGFYSPSKDTAATILAQRRRQGFCDDTITNYIGQNDVDVEGGSFRTGDKHDSDRIVRMQEKIAQIKEKFEQRVDTTQSKLATQAQKAKEYRQQQLLKLQGTQDDGNQRHQPSMSAREREDMLRSPGYAKEVQSLRLQQQQKTQSAKGSAAGSATVWQSAFNLANILMGVGLLGLPFGFKVAGYWGGFVCVLVFGMITWRTSILIGRELNGDPRPSHAFDDNPFQSPYAPGTTRGRLLPPIAGFPDIARRSFGETGCLILSILLYFELFSCVCIFFVAIGDHLHSIFPTVPLEMLTILAATISLGPTIFLHTPRLLSYFSMVGTFATVAVVGTVVAAALLAGSRVEEIQSQQAAMTGHAVTESPYQGWGNVQGIIMCLGLVAYCFSGHAIVPSIYTSMKEPQRFEEMVTLTFVMVMLVCFAVACAGYYMFGSTVADQVTLSLEAAFHAGGAMDILIWLMILTAFSKTTLTIFPLALGMEEIFAPYFTSERAVDLMSGSIKFTITILALLVSLYVPSFSFLCALTGMICTMAVSVVFPAAAHWKIFYHHLPWWEHVVDAIFVVLGIIMAVVGTIQTVK